MRKGGSSEPWRLCYHSFSTRSGRWQPWRFSTPNSLQERTCRQSQLLMLAGSALTFKLKPHSSKATPANDSTAETGAWLSKLPSRENLLAVSVINNAFRISLNFQAKAPLPKHLPVNNSRAWNTGAYFCLFLYRAIFALELPVRLAEVLSGLNRGLRLSPATPASSSSSFTDVRAASQSPTLSPFIFCRYYPPINLLYSKPCLRICLLYDPNCTNGFKHKLQI